MADDTPDLAPPDIAALSFEEALAELDKIVRQLEEGRGKLDEAIAAYERGAQLKRHCEDKLREAQAKVERIVLNPDGSLGTAPADIG
jgi:exodeoxyribonuclease VII small subunit